MNILCITDQFTGTNESLIVGIFREALKNHCKVYTVFFSRELQHIVTCGDDIHLPYKYKRHGAAEILQTSLDLSLIDIVLVRNFFPVLKSFLKVRHKYNFKLGFWNSFPHTYRRYFQALLERKSVLRKFLEYHLRTYFDKRLVRSCDFLIVMSEEFKSQFFKDVNIAYHCLPMGFNIKDIPPVMEMVENKVRKFIYIGTIDPLRKTKLLIESMIELHEEFQLDIYSQSNNAYLDQIRAIKDSRIRLLPALPRAELFKIMASYDVGIGLIPENPLFNVSSPTKTVEYYSVGIPAIVNYLPEYCSLFDEKSAFFCNFNKTEIQNCVRRVLNADKTILVSMGQRGKKRIEEERNYQFLADNLHSFFVQLTNTVISTDVT